MQCHTHVSTLDGHHLRSFKMGLHTSLYDDINICSANFDTHTANLQRIFDQLKDAGLKLCAKKCKLGIPELH